MTWDDLVAAACGTHHLRGGEPVYAERFDNVGSFHAPGLAPARQGAFAWHIRSDGGAAYSHRFSQTFGYYEQLAAVVAMDGWHHIDVLGNAAYRARYAWCGNFQGGRCAVRQHDGAYLHITHTGEPAYPDRWRYAGDYRAGIGVVQADDGQSTHVDRDGRRIHDRWYVDLDVFHKGLARAKDLGGWMHVDRTGQPVYSRRFASVEPFYNGHARVERVDGGLEVIDHSGKMVVELRQSPAVRRECELQR